MRAVVRDARALGRQRRVVRDLHRASSRSMVASQVRAAASALPAAPCARASSGCARSQANALGDGRRSRLHHEHRCAGPRRLRAGRPASRRRDHRLLREERLVRDEAQVLVDRRVEDGEAARVLLGERGVVQPPGEGDPPVEAVVGGDPLQALAVRPFTCDHDAQRIVCRGRLDQHVDPLRPVEPPHGEHEVAVLLAAVVELLRRRPEHLGVQPQRALEPVRHVLGDREHTLRLRDRRAIELGARPGGLRGRTVPRRTRRAPCGRARTPAGAGARARRPCSDAG